MKYELPTCLPTCSSSLSRPSRHLSLIRESHSPTGHPAKLPKFSFGTAASLCGGLTNMRAWLGRGHGLDDEIRLHVAHRPTVTCHCSRDCSWSYMVWHWKKKTAKILSYIQLVDISLRHNGESSISHLNRPSYRRNLYPSDGTILTTELPSLKSIAAWKRHNIHTWLDSIHSHKLSPVIGLNGRVNGSNLSNSYFSLWRVENIATCRLGIYLFGFLDNIASSADFVASYDRIISEYQIGKEMWRRCDLIWGSPHSHRWGQEVEENNQKI